MVLNALNKSQKIDKLLNINPLHQKQLFQECKMEKSHSIMDPCPVVPMLPIFHLLKPVEMPNQFLISLNLAKPEVEKISLKI